MNRQRNRKMVPYK